MDELNSFNKLMHRIGRTHCLLSQPHPLAHMSKLDVTTMNCSSFHSAFIKYCVKNNFVSLLYHYLDVYKLVHLLCVCICHPVSLYHCVFVCLRHPVSLCYCMFMSPCLYLCVFIQCSITNVSKGVEKSFI